MFACVDPPRHLVRRHRALRGRLELFLEPLEEILAWVHVGDFVNCFIKRPCHSVLHATGLKRSLWPFCMPVRPVSSACRAVSSCLCTLRGCFCGSTFSTSRSTRNAVCAASTPKDAFVPPSRFFGSNLLTDAGPLPLPRISIVAALPCLLCSPSTPCHAFESRSKTRNRSQQEIGFLVVNLPPGRKAESRLKLEETSADWREGLNMVADEAPRGFSRLSRSFGRVGFLVYVALITFQEEDSADSVREI